VYAKNAKQDAEDSGNDLGFLAGWRLHIGRLLSAVWALLTIWLLLVGLTLLRATIRLAALVWVAAVARLPTVWVGLTGWIVRRAHECPLLVNTFVL
jgi:hypothetical protein